MLSTTRTTCTMDCPDTCSLEVTVEEGVIRKIGAADDHPVARGFICSKVANFAKRVGHELRILHPMRRTGRKGDAAFERISWNEAIRLIAEKFQSITRDFGAEAILPFHYGGSNGLLGDGFLDEFFFRRLGASKLDKTVCAAPTGAVAMAMYGKMPGVAFNDYPEAKFILIWGANPRASNIHLVPFLQDAKKRGAFIATIDPSRNFNHKDVDLHIPVLPGMDLPIALSMIRHWNEQQMLDREFLEEHATGVDLLLDKASEWTFAKAAAAAGVNAGDLQKLAELYAVSSPALLRCGWGLERNRNGGQAVAAVLAMPALLGKFGLRGGGYTMSNSGATQTKFADVLGGEDPPRRSINMSQLGEVLLQELTPPVKALFVYNCNPVATMPNQSKVIRGLEREDLFTVVHEQVMTDTAAYADIVLPAVTFLEQYEIKKSYGSYVLGGVQPVIQARGEARPNEQVFAELGRAMGFDEAPFQWTTDECMEKVAAAISLDGAKPDLGTLRSGKIQRFEYADGTPVQFVSVFPRTADRKIHLSPSVLGPRPFELEDNPAASYPLSLISPSTPKLISSSMGEYNYERMYVTMHPSDAASRGVKDGDRVRVYNDLAEVVCFAEVIDRVRPGVVSIPKGAWRKSSVNGLTSNALSPSHVNLVAGGACFNDARVEIEKM